ncbi:Alpha/Beta hydrolase protein [Massariosphaeria phaeospora]|uniref:Alpha/Beta hydrolase protein n=1 Tax=Massariosphaeria phaeospora TaxID=100035 RepID=A0A7C8MN35_9PLEO|nr:Alpha/Beta hydrolase protein [Massariosphaeria phaeospora]
MASNLTIVLSTGSFCTPAAYAQPFAALTSQGYEFHIPQLLTAGKKPGPLPNLADDTAMLSALITKLADEDKDILLLAHSYGGTPASESIKGLSKAEREKAGKKGGVVRLGFMTSLVPPIGVTAGALMADARSGYQAIDGDGWLYLPDLALAGQIVFSSLPPEEATKEVANFVQHSPLCFASELTYAGYKDVPVSYLFCEKDECVPPSVQQAGIDMIEKESGNAVDVTRFPCDHVPSVTAPEKVVDWILATAAKC